MWRIGLVCRLAALLLALGGASAACAQQLSPRAYWPAPTGTNIFFLAASYQTGDIVTNPALPIANVDSRIYSGIVGFQRTTRLFGRTSNVRLEIPAADGTTNGLVEGAPGRRDVSGLGDLSATLSVNLIGAPAMNVQQFQAFRESPGPILAAGLKIVAPTGQYDEDRLINIGTNRWAARLRLGWIQPLAPKWLLEVSAGTWFFEDNDEFLGQTLAQDPLSAIDASLVRRFRPGFWASLDGTYYFGGRTTVENVGQADFQRNARIGLSVAYPILRRHVLKFSYSTGIETNIGGDYDAVALNYIVRLD
jgi:hypothetical protein